MNTRSMTVKIPFVLAGIAACLIILECALCLSASIAAAVAQSRNDRQLLSGGGYTILCLGESTTAPVSIKDGVSWPWHLSQILNRPGSGIRCTVINQGVVAADTRYIRDHLEENLKRYRPHMVVTMMGINDDHVVYYADMSDRNSFLFRHSRLYRFMRLMAREVVYRSRRHFDPKFSAASVAGPEGAPHSSAGMAHLERHRYKEAEREFNREIDRDPGCMENYINLGLTYEGNLEFEKMRAVYQLVVERFPRAVEGYAGLGWHGMQVGRFAEAEENFKRALAIEPRRDDLWMGLARACRAQGEHGAAIEALHEAAASDPKNDGAYAALALIYEHDLQQPERAEEFARQASQARRANINPVTAANYEAIYETLRSRGITMVCMQYPMRPLESLQAVFRSPPEDIVWVENRECFRNALRTQKYDELFIDMFGGDFGHCTSAGYRVIAENLAGAIEGRVRPGSAGR